MFGEYLLIIFWVPLAPEFAQKQPDFGLRIDVVKFRVNELVHRLYSDFLRSWQIGANGRQDEKRFRAWPKLD
jgi:hypothetical protein